MSIGMKLLIAFAIMAVLFTAIILLVKPIILRWFLVGLSVFLVLTFVNYLSNNK